MGSVLNRAWASGNLGWGSVDEKSLRKMPRARWNSGYTCITGVLWKIGQGDQISPGGRQMMRSVIKYWVGGGVLVTVT